MTLNEFIGVQAQYENKAQIIFFFDEKGGAKQLIDIRGYGPIQSLFKDKKGNVDFEAANKFQDQFGEWIAEAINEKIERQKKKSIEKYRGNSGIIPEEHAG